MRFWDFLLESNIAEAEVPRLRKGETFEDRKRIDEILEHSWACAGKQAFKKDDTEDRKFTYGEVTVTGTRQLIHFMGMEQIEAHEGASYNEPVIFYDLGSGAGKLVVHMFLEKVVTASKGIELSKPRHRIACKAWENAQKNMGLGYKDISYLSHQEDGERVEAPRVKFLNQDVLDADFSDATHIFVSSLCFPAELTEDLSKIIIDNYHKYGKLQLVAALSDLPLMETAENRKYWKKAFELIQMTWGLSTVRTYTVCNRS
jgi:hypothetical protein